MIFFLQHIKHLGGKARGQNENKMWAYGQCVCSSFTMENETKHS